MLIILLGDMELAEIYLPVFVYNIKQLLLGLPI